MKRVFAFLILLPLTGGADGVTRSEALAIAARYADHKWSASARNVRQGLDTAKVEVHTPDVSAGTEDGLWTPGQVNVGVPYKWGGFDTMAEFDAGVQAGNAAGDRYSGEKRRLGDRAVSAEARGVDCSGFISRCWKLPQKFGTRTLPSLCEPLRSATELQAGDIMNMMGGHVVLFARWLGEEKTRALFFEAHPFTKVTAREYEVGALVSSGFRPLRYRRMRD